MKISEDKPMNRGGRPPKGPIKGKTAQFTTRLRPETRAALQAMADKRGWSISQLGEWILREALESPGLWDRAMGSGNTKVLSALLVQLVNLIEAQTGEGWTENRFTFEAVATGIPEVLREFVPPGGRAKPTEKVKELAKENGRAWLTPKGLGLRAANLLLMRLRFRELPPNPPPGVHYSDDYYVLPHLRHARERASTK